MASFPSTYTGLPASYGTAVNAFVFNPSNENAGKFTVERPDEIHTQAAKFIAANPSTPDYSYIEAFGKVWTIVSRDPFTIQDGRVHRPAQTSVPLQVAPPRASAPSSTSVASSRGDDMQYKVVPFSAAVSSTQDASHLASQVETIISSYVAAGWKYVGIHQLQTFKAGSNGCFGLGATPPTTVTTEFVVFRQ